MRARSNDHVCIKLFSGAFRVSNGGRETKRTAVKEESSFPQRSTSRFVFCLPAFDPFFSLSLSPFSRFSFFPLFFFPFFIFAGFNKFEWVQFRFITYRSYFFLALFLIIIITLLFLSLQNHSLRSLLSF